MTTNHRGKSFLLLTVIASSGSILLLVTLQGRQMLILPEEDLIRPQPKPSPPPVVLNESLKSKSNK